MRSVYHMMRCWKCVILSVFVITLFILWRQYLRAEYERNRDKERVIEGTLNTIVHQGNVMTGESKSNKEETFQDGDYENNDTYYNKPTGALAEEINQDVANKYPDAADYFRLHNEDNYGQDMHAEDEMESDDGNNKTSKVFSAAKQSDGNTDNLNEGNTQNDEKGDLVDEDNNITNAESLETIVPTTATYDYKQSMSHIKRQTVLVLVTSYPGAGSIIVAQHLSNMYDAFLIHQPFKLLIDRGYYKENLICFLNGTCRTPTNSKQRHDFVMYSLRRMFSCEFSKIHSTILQSFETYPPFLESHVQKWYRDCIDGNHERQSCVQNLENACLASKVIIIEETRLSLEVVETLSQYMPDLKIISVVRDPRAITVQMEKDGDLDQMNISDHSIELCFRMMADLKISANLRISNPDHIKTLMYENMAEQPEVMEKKLRQYLGLKSDTESVEFIEALNFNQREDDPYYWRSVLHFDFVKTLDRTCGDLYLMLGLINMDYEEDLGNFNIKSRLNHTDLGKLDIFLS